jgi:hypothetical protein
MPCPICGQNCNDYTPSPGAGVHVTRIGKGAENMAKVTLSKERWYVTADKTRAVRGGDPDAAFLLVGKGGAIAPEVAAHYGIETYTGESVAIVTQDRDAERERMVTEGTGSETAVNYEEMSLSRQVREQVTSSITPEENRSAGRQASMMAQSIIAEVKANADSAPRSSEPDSRTKEIVPDTPGGSEPPKEPDAGGKPPKGQDPEQMAKSLQELDDAKDKTL